MPSQLTHKGHYIMKVSFIYPVIRVHSHSVLFTLLHFLERSVQGRKMQTGYKALIKAPTHETQNTESRPDHNTGNFIPLFTISVWVLLRPLLTITSKLQETGPTVYSPYPSASSLVKSLQLILENNAIYRFSTNVLVD